jgi:hypothetical protein
VEVEHFQAGIASRYTAAEARRSLERTYTPSSSVYVVQT